MNLRRLNLNLLLMLHELIETRQVTLAGRKLGLTQPAASTALAKLRHAFDDDLLVPVGREFQLTPKAEALRESVQHAIDSLEAVFKQKEFVPQHHRGEFIIATADYMSIVLLPHLIEVVSAAAPGLKLRVTNLNKNSAVNLKEGEIDMIVAPMPLLRGANLRSRHLFDDRLVCVYRCESLAQRRQIGLREYLASRHITTVVDNIEPLACHSSAIKEIDGLRSRQDNVAVVPHYAALPLIAAGSSLLALVQERLVRKFIDYLPIAYTEPPIPLPRFEYAMFWSGKVNGEPSHKWMRDTLVSVCQKAFPRA